MRWASHILVVSLLACASTQAEFACPFATSGGNKTLTERAIDHIETLQKACTAAAPDGELQKTLAELRTRLDQAFTASFVENKIESLGMWRGMNITCSTYTAALSAQRNDAEIRFTNGMAPSTDHEYAACTTDKTDPVPCFNRVAMDKLKTASEFCNSVRRNLHQEQNLVSLTDSFRTVDATIGHVLQRLPQECPEFSKAPEVMDAAIQLTTTVAASFALVQPVGPLASSGVVLGANLIKRVSQWLAEPRLKALAAFKKEESFPAKACLLYELQQASLNCTKQLIPEGSRPPRPAVNAAERRIAGSGDASNAAVQDLLNAMNATEEAAKHTADKKDRPVFYPSLDALSEIMQHPIPNPDTAHHWTPSNKRVDWVLPGTYLRKVASDFRSQGSGKKSGCRPPGGKAPGPEELGAMKTMAGQLDRFVDAWESYTKNTSNPSETNRDALIQSIQTFSQPIWDHERYANRPMGGLLEMLHRHWEMCLPQDSGLNQVRNYELGQVLYQGLDSLPLQRDTQAPDALVMDAFSAVREMTAKPLVEQMKRYEAKLENLQAHDVSKTTLNDDFNKSVQPLLRVCALLGASLNMGENESQVGQNPSAAEYRNACGRFQCGEQGLPLFTPAKDPSDRQNLISLHCKNTYDYTNKWEPFFRNNYVHRNRSLCGEQKVAEPKKGWSLPRFANPFRRRNGIDNTDWTHR